MFQHLTLCGILRGWWIMELLISRLNLAFPIVIAALATLWVVWPEKYVECLQAIKEKLKWSPAARAGVERVEAVFPLSSSKPWYPKYLRVMGIVIWLLLLSIAYMVYKF
jgi:hypothetical protein